MGPRRDHRLRSARRPRLRSRRTADAGRRGGADLLAGIQQLVRAHALQPQSIVCVGGVGVGAGAEARRGRRIVAREPLHKPHADRVAREIGMIARSATKVVAWTTMPRSATKRAPDFAATRMGWGFSGGLRRCSACEYVELFAAPRALHPIPENLHRERAGLMQRFLSVASHATRQR